MSPPLRVIKLGGSLLDWPELPAALRRWLAEQPAAANLLIVGGGKIVDQLRHLDDIHQLPPATSHWLAIEAMRLTGRLVLGLFPEALPATGSRPVSLPAGSLAVFDPLEFLKEDSLRADALPPSWQVTSDSIAARVAQRLGASELVLLKSAASPRSVGLAQLAEQGVVDAEFPRVAAGLNVRLVNLRSLRQQVVD